MVSTVCISYLLYAYYIKEEISMQDHHQTYFWIYFFVYENTLSTEWVRSTYYLSQTKFEFNARLLLPKNISAP